MARLSFAMAPPAPFPPAAPPAPRATSAGPGDLPPSIRAAPLAGGRWLVTFTIAPTVKASRAALAGDFNQWSAAAAPMRRGDDGSWSASVELAEGRHAYKFVLDGDRWIADPRNPDGVPDGHEGRNSVLRLGAEEALSLAARTRGDGRIEAAALRHDPARAAYRQKTGDGAWLLRYRTLAGDVEAVDLATRQLGSFPMQRAGTLEPFDWWEAVLPATDATLDYTFLISDGATQLRDADLYSLDPHSAAPFTTPAWAKNAVWYQIMVDRFRNGDPSNDPANTRPWRSEWYGASPWEGKNGETFYNHFVFGRMYGGDLAGMRAALPYLKDLGVNALYLLPMFQASTPHKYNATSYIHIDDAFGVQGEYEKAAAVEDLLDPSTWTWTKSDRQFLDFIKDAKKMGFRVIIDGVFNHVGTRHPAFVDVQRHGRASRFADWFHIKNWEPFDYEGWFGFNELPVFRKDEAHGIASATARQHIFDITRRWMDPNGDGDPSDGVDGWRLDVPNEVPMAFWREWRALVKRINPDAYITGEIWTRADAWLDGGAFDAVMNYEFAKPAIEWALNREKKIPPSELDARLARLRLAYPAEATYAMQNLLDSHDTDRVASMARNPDRVYNDGNREQAGAAYDASKPRAEDYRRVRLLALLQMTYVGAPMIWYGTEVGMWGSGDPNNRKPMLWKDLEPYEASEDNHVVGEQLDFYRRAIALRREHAALRTGSFQTVLTDDAQDVWVFLRRDAREQVLVALNAGEREAAVTLPAALGDGWTLVFGAPASPPSFPSLSVPPVSGCVWVKPAPSKP